MTFPLRIWPLLIPILLLAACVRLEQTADPGPDDLWVNLLAVEGGDGSRQAPLRSLRDAVIFAGDNTRIHLAPGTYRVNITVGRRLTLIGPEGERAILRPADEDRPIVEVTEGATAALTNLDLNGGVAGVLVQPGGGIELNGCAISECGTGVDVRGGSGDRPTSMLRRCTIQNNATGIIADSAMLLVFMSEVVENQGPGMVVAGDGQVGVVASRINENMGDGIVIAARPDTKIELLQNDVRANDGHGIAVAGGPGAWWSNGRIRIEQNTVTGNDGWGIAFVDQGDFAPPSIWGRRLQMGDNELAGNRDGAVTGP